jgi:hypothetical protein
MRPDLLKHILFNKQSDQTILSIYMDGHQYAEKFAWVKHTELVLCLTKMYLEKVVKNGK